MITLTYLALFGPKIESHLRPFRITNTSVRLAGSIRPRSLRGPQDA
jgi:hypothetical protein